MYLKHQDLARYWAIDIETDGLNATRIWCIILRNIATGHVDIIASHDGRVGAAWLSWLACHPGVILVGHNALSFDVPTLNRLTGSTFSLDCVVDTLVLSYLYDPAMARPEGIKGTAGAHSLEAWGLRLRLPKGDWSDWSQLSDEMLEYCEQDVNIVVTLFLRLTERMRKRGYSERSCKLEHDIRHVIDKQQRNGFYFDIRAAENLYEQLRERERNLAVPIRELFPRTLEPVASYSFRTRMDGSPYSSYDRHVGKYPRIDHRPDGTYTVFDWSEFNIGSPKQRIDKLLSLGFKPTKFTKKGNPQVDEETLIEFAKESGVEQVQMIADWLVLNGRANMINTWMNAVDIFDSRMHGRVMSCGAGSRRMTHNSPNTANIPSNEAKYGHECRSLWTVQDVINDCLVGYDAKSAQMRCFAHFLPDPNAGRKYWDQEFCPDPHQLNADLIGILRRPVKNVFYANMFGAYPPKLATTAGFQGTKKEQEAYGTWIREQLYETTPGLRELTEQAQAEFDANNGFMECIDGGYVRCPAKNAALNYKIQPAEAVLMKTAAVFIDKRSMERGIEQLKVADIHDEGQHQVRRRQAQEFGELCVQALRDAGEDLNLRVPFDGDFKIGNSWAETH